MTTRTRLLIISLLLGLPAALTAQAHDHSQMASGYADMMDREIKALSAEDTEGLLAGEGMGLALAAELNGYPGPKHALEMREMLGLTEAQVTTITGIFEEMQSSAIALGTRIVELEGALDRAFAAGEITEAQLAMLVKEIAGARGELRTVHLRAHLLMRPVLTEEQRAHYQMARGYHGG